MIWWWRIRRLQKQEIQARPPFSFCIQIYVNTRFSRIRNNKIYLYLLVCKSFKHKFYQNGFQYQIWRFSQEIGIKGYWKGFHWKNKLCKSTKIPKVLSSGATLLIIISYGLDGPYRPESWMTWSPRSSARDAIASSRFGVIFVRVTTPYTNLNDQENNTTSLFLVYWKQKQSKIKPPLAVTLTTENW